MSWTRLDDNWSDKMRALGLNHEQRAWYLALIQWCSKNGLYDGRVRNGDARIVTDSEDPGGVLASLADLGRLAREDGHWRVVHIDDYLPPEYMRDEARKEAEREKKRRQRAHRAGVHTECSPDRCPETVPRDIPRDTQGTAEENSRPRESPADVPRDTGTGQDRPGREELPPVDESATVPTQRDPCPHCRPGEVGCDQCMPDLYGAASARWGRYR